MTVIKMFNRNGYDNPVTYPVYFFSNLVNDLFRNDDFLPGYSNKPPKANVIEENEAFILNLAIPGINKSDIKMEVEKEILTISHSNTKQDNNISYSRKEFDFENFERKFRIPEIVDVTKIKARYVDGILWIELPKKKEAIDKGPREIKIS